MTLLRRGVGLAIVIGLLNLSTARLRSPETGYATRMIAALTALRSLQMTFAASCGRGAYASSLAQFADTSPLDGPNIVFTGIELQLKALPDGGPETFDCHGQATTRAFYATAAAGRRWWGPTFALDANGRLWRSETATPPLPPFDAPGLSIVR